MTEVITKKPMKLGTVNIPVGTTIGGLPEDVIRELVPRGLADLIKKKTEEPKVEKPHKERKNETGF